ncbi:MAG: pyridoxal-phosphate dependent enzyme, partial [Pseudomonadota bacterium]|nr:pyridoxal-phosphate dependent enzyme [Pseudomonadota bacterium]
MTDQTRPAVSIDDIRAATTRIAPYAVRTPLVESPLLNERLGFRLLVKAECLQHTGSFKLRGATNTVMSLPDSVTDVVAWSSGNHAQAVARAAALRGIRAAIVMPEDAPAMKIEGTNAYGAEVVTYDRYSENREEIGGAIAAERGAELIPPFEDARVIAGQG